MKINQSEIKKILCIKPRGIGDIILSTIVLENLKEFFPTADIHYLTEEFAKLSVANNPLVAKTITMKKSEFIGCVIRRVRKEKYDLVFDFWSNPRSAQITFLSGAKFRVGFSYRVRKYAYNHLAAPGRGSRHSAEHNLELLHALNIPISTKNIHFYLSESEKSKAAEYRSNHFKKSDLVLGIIPSGGWESKRCDASKWIEFCKALHSAFHNKFLILWGPGDELDANEIFSVVNNCGSLAPQTDVSEMAGLISNCDIVIANDSGPMHIAAALKIPTIGIFGPTDPLKHGPYSSNSDYLILDELDCIICNKLICPINHECMKNLSPGKLVEKARRLLNEKH